jgi:hypothetical protein
MRSSIRRRPRGPAQAVWGEDDSVYLGPNLIANGDFGSALGWLLEAGWTIVGGVAVALLSTGALSQASAAIKAGRKYQVSVDIVALSLGGLRFDAGGALGLDLLSVGTKTQVVTAAADGVIALKAVGTFTGTIDNVVVREIFA